MNYLAHAHLAEPTEAGRFGALLGDFVRGAPDPALPPAVRRGILMHRRIDGYTDAHPVHRTSRRRFAGARRRFAGIVVDVAYDHFLARSWRHYSQVELATFVAAVYAALEAHRTLWPPRLRSVAPRMMARDWLASYADPQSIGRALGGIAQRVPWAHPLAGAQDEVERHYDALADDFAAFYPDLCRFAASLLAADGGPQSVAGSALAPHTRTPTRSPGSGR